MKNYYQILQVTPDADSQEIRQAFRRLSLEYHPDRHGGSRLYENKFKEINQAYQVLRDPIQRWQYKQDIQRTPNPAAAATAWNTPDFAARHARPHRPSHEHRRRQRSQPRPQEAQGTDLRSLFWIAVLGIVLLFPFLQAGSGAGTPERRQVNYEESYRDYSDFSDHLKRRFHRDVRLLNEISREDPGLRGLDLETGHYEWRGRTVRLSWDVLQLVREQEWKLQ